MPYQPITELDQTRVQQANDMLCTLWNIPGLRPHQEKAGTNLVQGINTVLDVPTGGGKTLAFWWPLFYHWTPETDKEASRKNLIVVSPLVALMQDQAKDLVSKGIPAIALTSQTENVSECMEKFGNNEYRVAFVSPEMAIGKAFHKHVLKSRPFADNNIGLIIDEAHAIEEWGTDDFRDAYGSIPILKTRMPTGVPILLASATLPSVLLESVVHKLGIASNYEHLAFKNNKPNVALSVRVMQHVQGSYADLFSLFPLDATGPADFPQTLIYVNSRKEAEEIQDFLRRYRPACIPDVAFEFYHRYVDEKRKLYVQDHLKDGSLRAVSATDALGMGMDFSLVKRVILWREPKTFLSLVQKIGRCVRLITDLGEVILFVTKAAYTQHLSTLEAEDDVLDGPEHHDDANADGDVQEGQQGDRDAAVEGGDDDEPVVTPAPRSSAPRRGQKKTATSAFEKRDRIFLSRFITTTGCRRKVWDDYFNNDEKLAFFDQPPGARGCDQCHPERFPVNIINIIGPSRERGGRGSKPTPELTAAITIRLKQWRKDMVLRDFGNQSQLTGKLYLPNDIIVKIAERPRAVTTTDIFHTSILWRWGTHNNGKYGSEVLEVVKDVLSAHPDKEQEKRDSNARAKALDKFLVMASKQRHTKLRAAFDECWEAVCAVKTGRTVHRGRGIKQRTELEMLCQPFMALPRRTAYPDYYEIIEQPISMSTIKKLAAAGPTKGYASLVEYAADWRVMFANARIYNIEESQIYEDSQKLEAVFEAVLKSAADKHGLLDDLPTDSI